MGWTWEVEAYERLNASGYAYQTMWTGESLFRAVLQMRKVKRAGYGAVRLTWRS